MACPVLLYPSCKLTETVGAATGAAARGVTRSGLDGVAQTISQAIAGLVRTTVAWWVGVPSVDVSGQPVIDHLRAWFLPIAVAVTVAGLIAAGTRMAVARKANPLIDVTGGLLVIAITAAVGVLVPDALLKAGDAWSTWVLDHSVGDQFGTRMASLLSLNGASTGFVVVVGIVVLVLSVVQAVLMLLRETAIVILIGTLPLAAAGAMAPGMRGWIKKVAAWLLALIFFKPAAAAVYATAFTMIGSGNSGIRDQLMGLCALILALVALPTLVKFFTFAVGSAGQHSGGGILGAATGAMVAMGSLRSAGGGAGSSAVSQANYTNSHMPPPAGAGGTGSGAGTGAGSSSGSTPSGGPAAGAPPQAGPGTGDGSAGGDRGRRGSGAPGPAPSTANAAASRSGTAASGTSAASGAGAASTGAASGAAGGTAGTTAGATAAGAAGGPAGAVATAGVAAGQKAADGARNAAGSAMTPDGSESQ